MLCRLTVGSGFKIKTFMTVLNTTLVESRTEPGGWGWGMKAGGRSRIEDEGRGLRRRRRRAYLRFR